MLKGDPDTIVGQEDCLIVNVYTPQLPSSSNKEKLPVLLFIHGGAFYVGDGSEDLLGPDRLMDYGIVVVYLQYRLGLLASLSTGDREMAGNMGMWDQREAMIWVRDNIEKFGGDPNKVLHLKQKTLHHFIFDFKIHNTTLCR